MDFNSSVENTENRNDIPEIRNRVDAKNRVPLICLLIIAYTILVVGITIAIDRAVIGNRIQNGFQEVFSDDFEEEVLPGKNLAFNETVIIGDVMELTLESFEWTEEIKPSNTSGVYSYYQNQDGEKYFLIKGKARNIAGENLNIGYVNEAQITINDKYKSDVNIEAEALDGSSFYGSIKPLQTLNIILYASVSDEVYEICENVKLSVNILSDSTYISNFYDADNPHEDYSIVIANTSGAK